jgi:hypothetical protein
MQQRMNRVLVIAVATAAIPSILVAGGTAAATELCTPAPKVSSSFCVDPSLTLSSQTAADPLTVDLAGADTSTNFSSDTNEWVQSISLDLLAAGSSPPLITPSSSMPDGLLISNSPSCGSPPYTECAAGHGVIAANLSGTVLADGYHEGSFGIRRIVNVADAGAGNLARYRADIEYSFTIPPAPTFTGSFSAQIDVPESAAGASIVVPTRYPVSQPPVSADATIKSFALHLDGQSNTLEGGAPAADRVYRIFGVSARCGAGLVRATFTSGDSRTLSTQQNLSVTGCPSAGAAYSISGRKVRLNGGQSSTPVAARSIAHWAWTFDDGSRTTTDAPTVSHSFGNSRDHTVGLTVTDSAGAVSEPISLVVPGSAVTVRAKAKQRSIRVSGRLTLGPTGAGGPGPVSVDLRRRKPHRKRFVKVGSKSTRARGSGAYSLSFARPKGGRCQVIASFGDSSHLGSSATRNFKC